MKTPILPIIVFYLLGSGFVYAETELNDLNEKVETLYFQGNYVGAIRVAKMALKIAERDFGQDHFNVAASLNNLAELYRAQGQYTMAKPLLRRALLINENALGPDHIDVAMNLNNLALLLHAQKQYTEVGSLH